MRYCCDETERLARRPATDGGALLAMARWAWMNACPLCGWTTSLSPWGAVCWNPDCANFETNVAAVEARPKPERKPMPTWLEASLATLMLVILVGFIAALWQTDKGATGPPPITNLCADVTRLPAQDFSDAQLHEALATCPQYVAYRTQLAELNKARVAAGQTPIAP